MHIYAYPPSNLDKIKILRKKNIWKAEILILKTFTSSVISCYKINLKKLETFKAPPLFPSSFFPFFCLSRFLHSSRYPVRFSYFLSYAEKKNKCQNPTINQAREVTRNRLSSEHEENVFLQSSHHVVYRTIVVSFQSLVVFHHHHYYSKRYDNHKS